MLRNSEITDKSMGISEVPTSLDTLYTKYKIKTDRLKLIIPRQLIIIVIF